MLLVDLRTLCVVIVTGVNGRVGRLAEEGKSHLRKLLQSGKYLMAWLYMCYTSHGYSLESSH